MTIDDGQRKSQRKSAALFTFFPILALALAAMLVQGYHPGAEDDGVYLAAIHSDLNPALFPYDSQFFRVQMQASLYDRVMAATVRLLHLPVNVTMLLWQFVAICLVLYACLRMARRIFGSGPAHWSAVTLVATLFSLPVAGTALFLIDPQLHPRTLATSLILFAAELVLARRAAWTAPLLLGATVLHPIMGAFGMSFCFFLWLARRQPSPVDSVPDVVPAILLEDHEELAVPVGSLAGSLAGSFAVAPVSIAQATRQWAPAVPADRPHDLAWLLDKPTVAWRLAMGTRHYIFLSRWEWYEWLGAIAPPLLLAWCWQWAKHRSASNPARANLARLAGALVAYSIFQLAFAIVVAATPALVRLLPLQPMRFLHLVYLLGSLIAGGLLGEFLLRKVAWRWALAFVPLAFVLFLSQRSIFPATPHLELPGISDGAHSSNPWLQSFAWIARNTPANAYFALDPGYMELHGEDYHGFRALAQRSILADSMKDSAVAMQVPRLAPVWLEQVTALQGFQTFQPADFARLQQNFGVTWTILPADRNLGFDCPYRNAAVQVCRLP